jgi:hypothetical protein
VRILTLLLFLLATPAFAGTGTIAVTPGSGATIATTTDGSSNNLSHGVTCDQSAGANCQSVKAASTAAVAADQAAVVALSPNNGVVQGAAAASGPWLFTPWIAGAVNSATNGLYFNPLQGNAVLSATNGMYTNILQGNAVLTAASPLPVGPSYSGDIVVTPSSSFTRPANTTAYALGFLVANSTTAGSVVPLSWTVSRVNAGNGYVRRAIMTSTGKSVTLASFVLYLTNGTTAPTTSAGDGAASSGALLRANQFCIIPIILTSIGSDIAMGEGVPDIGSECNFVTGAGVQTIWGFLVANAAYVPTSAEVEKLILEVHEN